MSDITLHIKELLFRHDCVILPGFGGFIGNYRPAGIDTANNRFSPPVKAISFNRNLTHNDGLLIGKISEERKIGYADSKQIVDDFIESLKNRLAKGDRVVIEKVGYFQLNSESNIEFEPDKDTNFLLDSYGFGSFTREPVSNFDLSRRVSGRDRRPIRTSSSRKMAIRAAFAVPLLAAMIIIPLKTDLLKSNASLNPMASIEIGTGDSSISHAEVSKEQQISSEETMEISPVLTAEIAVVSSYHIVAGSFRNEDNARNLMQEVKGQGFASQLLSSDNGFYRVTLESFASKQEAIDRKSEILGEFPDSWILKN